MDSVHELRAIGPGDRAWAGEKAVSLGELIGAGCETPSGFCISAEAYRRSVAASSLERRISTRLVATDMDDPVELEAAAEEIRGWIEQMAVPGDVVDDIEKAVQGLGAGSVAVRVSRLSEDVVNPRASGLEQAFLAVKPEGCLHHVRRLWATPWTSRGIYYRRLKKIADTQVAIAVVVQTMADAEAAGVMFTSNPLTLAGDEIHIDANWGLGEAVNAARWPPNHFVVAKHDLAIREREVPGQELMEITAPDGGLQTVTVPPDKQARACLDDPQIVALAALGKRVEAQMGAAQDMEWCAVRERLLLLQTRPLRRK